MLLNYEFIIIGVLLIGLGNGIMLCMVHLDRIDKQKQINKLKMDKIKTKFKKKS